MKKHMLIAATLTCMAASAQGQPAPGAPGPVTNWPQEINAGGIHLVVYQPQLDTWKKDRVEMRAAASATRQGETNEIFGVITFSARAQVDKEVRMVGLEELKVTNVTFPGADSFGSDLDQMIRQSFQSPSGVSISLDQLLADVTMGNAEFESETASPKLKNDPPKIILATSPSVLIIVDGDPVLRDIAGSKYKRVINTPALLVYDPAARIYYLDGLTRWMTATTLDGPWTQASAPPADLDPLRAQAAAEEDKAQQGPRNETTSATGAPLAVYISTGPAELLQTQGPPQFAPIPKTQLLYVTNTGSDIFADAKKKNFYVLLSGRWYEATSLSGPWNWLAGEKLPRDFSRIPPDAPKSAVLASVPGTVEAREAVIANAVPQTAVVKRSEAKLTVRYDGAPQFKPIEGTALQYAINTPTDVILIDGRYYALQDGIWFVASAPLGPWAVADVIPPEIYSIPPSSPLYHVRFVYIFGSTPDYVDFGYTPGYLGAFASDGVVVFGTGWWYPGWSQDMYFGWPWTWGFGVQFGYWTGGWFWRPVGGAWWYYDPWWARRIYHGHHNPHWPSSDPERLRGNANVYSRWPASTVVSRGLRQPPLLVASAAAGQHPDLYASKEGHVYERRPDGWFQRDTTKTPQKVKTPANLENVRQARSLGAARQREFQSSGHVSGMPHVAAPRMSGGGGGGGSRGGGRR
jgi:hypothetical protein